MSMNYCTNETNQQFEQKILTEILEPLRRFDKRTLDTKPTMAKARKRLVFGAVETRKQLELGKIKGIIIATNITDETVLEDDFRYCIEGNGNVPKIYCLTRKQLGSVLVNPSTRVGIVGIMKLDGVYEAWNKITEEWTGLKTSWIQKYENDPNCIWSCCFYGHTDVLKRIFANKKPSFITKINQGCFSSGRTPLMVAVQRNHYEVVKFLIEEIGADEDIPDFALNRPIHVVSSERIARLLKYSTKANASGLTPIEVAVVNDRIEVVKVFLEQSQNINVEQLFIAATKSKTDQSIKFLHKTFKDVKLNFLNGKTGNNLLMEAVENSQCGSYEVFKYLITSGLEINFNHVNNNNETILNIAERVGNKGILRNLQSKKNKVLL